MIVDSHVHTEAVWSEPVEVISFQMESNGVSHAVFAQLNGRYDNGYLLECVHRFDGRFKAVGGIDPHATNRVGMLKAFQKQGGSGIRVDIRTERDWGPDHSLFRAAGDLGIIVSVIGKSANFASARFKNLLDDCRDTHFCLEHLARSPGKDAASPPYDTYREALKCGDWPNTSIKVPGLGEILVRPEVMPTEFPWEIPPHYQMAKAAFGVQRMMWGSNFPPCGRLEGYRNALQWVRRIPDFQSGDDLGWILGRTAAKLWGFASSP